VHAAEQRRLTVVKRRKAEKKEKRERENDMTTTMTTAISPVRCCLVFSLSLVSTFNEKNQAQLQNPFDDDDLDWH
jgi:replicative superfamily II helicase